MGTTFEIFEYNINKYRNQQFEYHQIYSGNSYIRAIYILLKTKLMGAGCIKIEWR